MTQLRYQPKSDYLDTAKWGDLYVLTEHWQSEMDYFRDELLFFSNLISKYFIWLSDDQNTAKVKNTINKIAGLKKQQEDLSERVKKHLLFIGKLMENASNSDQEKFRKDHEALEEEIAAFVKNFRVTKKEVFALTEHIMESEKLQHLLKE